MALSSFLIDVPQLPLAAVEAWQSKWLTPIWFFGVGVALGLVLLLAFVVLARILAQTPWSNLSKSPAGHLVALAISLAITAVVYVFFLRPVKGNDDLYQTEIGLMSLAVFLLSSIASWALVFCCSKQASNHLFATLGEGAAFYMGLTALVIVLLGAVSTYYVENPMRAINTIPQLFSTGLQPHTITVPGIKGNPDDSPFQASNLQVDFSLLDRVEIKTNRTISLADAESVENFVRAPIRVQNDEILTWSRTQGIEKCPITNLEGRQLHIQNREIDPAEVTVTLTTRPAVPQSATFFIAAIVVFLVGAGLLLQQSVAPRASAIALATIKNELAQPLFLVIMALGTLGLILFEFLPFNTFGEDIKMLKENGIVLIMLLAAFQGIWSASSSISEEIEGRTALTVLSKPIQRRSYVIGKFLGIFWLLMLMFVVLGTIELVAVAYKPIYDGRENSISELTWQTCNDEMLSTIPGLALAFMQAVVLSAISVALATRLPQLANLAICFAIYAIGNLATALVAGTQNGFEIVKFIAQLVSTIVPILEHFSLQAAIDAGNPITMSLLSGSLLYCLLYVLLSMFLALLLFEDRDLA